jgi:hypothetical protein
MVAKTDYTKIVSLLETLPPESLMLVEQFVRFLQAQAQKGEQITVTKTKVKPYLYPTVSVPTRKVRELIGIMPPVGGNALADTESLYDRD